jgi:UTP:GlnB (protein PII) uridylyltransferase
MIFERFKEKQHIRKKIGFVYQKIWDLKLVREQLRAVRENIRQNYDLAQEQLRGFNDKIKADPEAEKNEQFMKFKEESEKKVEELMNDITSADKKIEETTQQIAQHRQALPLFEQYIKQL